MGESLRRLLFEEGEELDLISSHYVRTIMRRVLPMHCHCEGALRPRQSIYPLLSGLLGVKITGFAMHNGYAKVKLI